ncbi:MAG TPA: D-alanyl-alanine synthetase [Gammaproteobacteria bacterium]
MLKRLDITPVMLDRLRHGLRIAVICSGSPDNPSNIINRTHNPRGWKSYRSGAEDIRDALSRCGFESVEILEEGRNLGEELAGRDIDVAWLNGGGVQGYDGMCHAAAMLESLGIAYVGHRPSQAALMDNKYHFKTFLKGLAVPTAPFVAWDARKNAVDITATAEFRNSFRGYRGPFIVKPVSGRASNNVSFVESIAGLNDAIERVNHVTDGGALVETYLPGREFCIAAAGPLCYRNGALALTDGNSALFCFSRLERVLGADEKIFTSMDIMPITANRIRLLNDDEDGFVISEMNRLTASVYRALSLNGMIRADLRQGLDGTLHVLEFNPKPDLRNSSQGKGSLIALGLAGSNIGYDELILNQLLVSLSDILTYRSKSARSLVNIFNREGISLAV